MDVNPKVKWALGLVAVIVLAVCTYLGIKLPEPDQVSGFEQTRGGSVQVNKLVVQDALTVGGAFVAAGATTQTGAFAADGGLTVGGGYGSTGCTVTTAGVLQCDGATTLASTLAVTGTTTIGGGYGSTGCTVSTAGVLQCDGAATLASTLAVTGTTTIGGGYGNTGCTISGAGVFQCDGAATFDGGITDVVPVLTKDADYQITADDTGSIIKNTSVVSATFTLPSAAAGLNYCFFNYSGSDVVVDPVDGVDTILGLTNSPGDSITNTTAYDAVCLVALDTTNWVVLETGIGTWADGN